MLLECKRAWLSINVMEGCHPCIPPSCDQPAGGWRRRRRARPDQTVRRSMARFVSRTPLPCHRPGPSPLSARSCQYGARRCAVHSRPSVHPHPQRAQCTIGSEVQRRHGRGRQRPHHYWQEW